MLFSLCIESIYPQEDLKKKLEKIKQAGFNFIEFWDWRDKDFELIENSGLKVSNFSGNRTSSLTLDDKKTVIKEVNTSIDVAKRLKCNYVTLLSDRLKSNGNVEFSSESKEKKLLRLYENFKVATEVAKKRGINLVVEPLNSLKDHKNYFLNNFQITLELVQAINSEHLKMLYDIYHMQIIKGNILETLQKYYELIGYIHVANVPYRCEPWIGELDYRFILKELSKIYSGFIGFEFFVRDKSFTFKKLYEWIHLVDS